MRQKIEAVLDHLASAYGGHSQYRLEDIGRAFSGQINNNGWQESPEDLAGEAAAFLAERWQGQGNAECEDATGILAACRKALAELGVR